MRRGWLSTSTLLVAIALLTTWPTAAALAQPPAVVEPLAPRVGVSGAPLSITLADAIRMTLEQNNDVAIAKLDIDVARQNVLVLEGVYDPRVIPNFGYQRNVSANTSAIGGATEGRLERTEVDGGVGLTGRTPWGGGRYTVDFSGARLDTSNQFARLNPEFPSALTGTYVQPLLRGRTIDLDRRNILVARRAVDLTDAQLSQVVMDQLTLVEEAYWDLAFASGNLVVLTDALAQARGQVASNERQVSQGTLAPIDVVEAQTQVSRFQQAVFSGQQALTEAENRLKRLMLTDRTSLVWNQPLVPADLADRTPPPQPLDQALTLALTRRPELKSLEIQRAQNEIDQSFFKNQTKPQVNVVGGYTLSGLAGDPLSSTVDPPVDTNDPDAALFARLNQLSLLANLEPLDTPPPSTSAGVPDFFVGGLGRSFSNLFARRFPTVVVQLQMEFPIRNRSARANLARSEIVATQLERRQQQLGQRIEGEVRDAMQAVRSSEQRREAAANQRRYAQEQYESEQRRFESGLSTVFLVLDRQTSFVTAQALELRARADLNQAIAQLERAIGGTLEWHRVKLQP
jgi:HAE1 family hydrophobic/amphiphilic exporter-1